MPLGIAAPQGGERRDSIIVPESNTSGKPMHNGLVCLLYNSASAIKINWNSLFQAEYPLSIHVIDNASTDGGPELLEQAGVPVHRNTENTGYTAAMNQGLRHFWDKDIDWLFIINPDAGPLPPHWDAKLLLPLLTTQPRIGLIGARLIDDCGSVHHSGGIITQPLLTHLTVFHDLGNGTLVAQKDAVCPTRFRHRTADVRQAERVSWVTFAVVALRMEMVRDVGLLDPMLWLYCSDAKYAMQAAEKGWETWYNPQLTVLHEGGGGLRMADSAVHQQAIKDIRRFAMEEEQWLQSQDVLQP